MNKVAPTELGFLFSLQSYHKITPTVLWYAKIVLKNGIFIVSWRASQLVPQINISNSAVLQLKYELRSLR